MIEVAVILAAGRGTRLKEITATRSKAMAPIAGSPMIVRVLDSLRQAGVARFVVVAAPGDRQLRELCACLPGVEVREQREPRGSGDALMACEGLIEGPFVVSACDSLIPARDVQGIVTLFERDGASAAVAVQEVSVDTPLGSRSVLALSGNEVRTFIEKPSDSERISNITALPLWVLSEGIWKRLRALKPSLRGEYELPATFNQMIADGQKVVAYQASGREDLTDIRDLLRLNKIFLRVQAPALQVHHSVVVPDSIKLVPPVLIEEGCVLGEGATLGPDVYLEHGVRVAAGVEIRESVVLSGASVNEDVRETVRTAMVVR